MSGSSRGPWGRWFSNRNLIVLMLVGMAVWLSFFDRDNLLAQREVNQEIMELEQERAFYREVIIRDSTVLESLSDSAFVEQYAREHFYYRYPGETVYIVR